MLDSIKKLELQSAYVFAATHSGITHLKAERIRLECYWQCEASDVGGERKSGSLFNSGLRRGHGIVISVVCQVPSKMFLMFKEATASVKEKIRNKSGSLQQSTEDFLSYMPSAQGLFSTLGPRVPTRSCDVAYTRVKNVLLDK